MEGAIEEVDLDAKIADMASRTRGKKTAKVGAKNKRGKRQKEEQTAVLDGKSTPADNGPPEIPISMFDYSVDNHIRAIERICKLSGEAECDDLEKGEVERLSSSITFLREWRQFSYQPRAVQFACQSESSPQGKDVISGITLPQFSSATVPRKDEEKNSMSMESRKDFVMYVGGPVWALDWCPRVHQRSGNHVKCEFVAVAAHPAESCYHKIGAPLIGRGIVQVWCILTTGMKEDELPQVSKPKQRPSVTRTKVRSLQSKRQRGRPRKNPINESGGNLNGNGQYLPHAHLFPENSSNFLPKFKSPPSKKQRGRRRKKAENECLDNLNGNDHHLLALAVRPPENSCNLLPLDIVSTDVHKDHAENDSGSKRKDSCQGVSGDNSLLASLSVRSLEDNARTRESMHEHDLPLLTMKVKSPQSKRQRGRPRKNPENESVADLNGNNQYMQPRAENSSNLLPEVKSPPIKKERGRPRKKAAKGSLEIESVDDLNGKNQFMQPLAEYSYNLLPEVKSLPTKKQRGRSRKKAAKESLENEAIDDLNSNNQYMQALAENLSNLLPEVKSPPAKKQRGRSRKKAAKEYLDNINGNSHHLQDLSVQLLENSSNLLSLDMISTGADKDHFHKDHAENDLSSLTQNEYQESFPNNPMILSNSGLNPAESSQNMGKADLSGSNATNCFIPMDVALPRVVLCLAHNGKVVWDVKWRPNVYGNEAKHRMGYLAVLLGNGALEVWDVPLPQTMNVIFSGCQEEGTDPRFVKLEPIFRCSKLKCGDRQSIPLTVEWSTSSPHDLILAGCHDGVVALWKFSASGISEDTRPLLCFSADTVPIRALAWAPFESDPESANVIVTAGHRGLKFWDVRDPFRPLWDLNTVQRTVYSLDWLPDPRCIIVSVDDGTLRILSLVKAAYDVPVSGKPFVGTQHQGFHSYYCSPFAIWSVQVSRPTGMVAYCCEDGTVLRFQLTYKAVEKDPLRNRAPHFLCGSLSEEESALTVISPLPDIPYPMKKSLSEWGNAPRTIRGFLSVSNQEKRAKEQTGKAQTWDDQPLALCYDNDPGTQFGSEDPGTSQTTKQRPKAQASSKKKQKADQALVCRDEEPQKVEKDEMDEIEVFPPKIVAMHRVRWNMNEGSQRWLCYGGAGGIVRCQEVDKPAVR